MISSIFLAAGLHRFRFCPGMDRGHERTVVLRLARAVIICNTRQDIWGVFLGLAIDVVRLAVAFVAAMSVIV